MSENCISIERLLYIARNLNVPHIPHIISRDGRLEFGCAGAPKPIEIGFAAENGIVALRAKSEGFRFDGDRRVEGVRFCNDWNGNPERPLAYLAADGELRLRAALFADKSMSDSYIEIFLFRYFLLSAGRIYIEAAKKFPYLPQAAR